MNKVIKNSSKGPSLCPCVCLDTRGSSVCGFCSTMWQTFAEGISGSVWGWDGAASSLARLLCGITTSQVQNFPQTKKKMRKWLCSSQCV